ncbi:MAG TPA: cytochrome d ubiquinol oxidase subunit II [Solirubrobacteraceae bacterium]|jgi:cytochrome d ubiquinol oxidase subunit II
MLHLHTLWYVIIAFFWTGFFVLEGFDFGVGVLHAVVGRTDEERASAIESIGPFWDGNEVWLVVAGAATFAAFPAWYATMFSALYLALLLILAGLMVRGVSFEFRSKLSDPRWRRTWTWATIVGSALVPLLIGIGLGDLLHGLPIDSKHEFTGNFFDLLTPYGLWTGVTLLAVSLLHGATFLMLKTTGAVRERSTRAARVLVWPVAAVVLGFVVWTRITAGDHLASPLMALVVFAVLGTGYLVYAHQEGWAFAGSAVTMAAAVIAIFVGLYPNVIVSSTNHAYNLTVSNSSSAKYALTVMTVVAIVFVPLVLLYQGWSYHVFRARVGGPTDTAETPAPPAPPGASLKT